MLLVTIVLFALAAVIGITMAYMRFSGMVIPFPLAIGHGLIAATAVVLLIGEVLSPGASTLLKAALGVFVLAALGGLTLFSFHLRGRTLPIPFILVHASVAVTGFIILLIAAFNQ